MSRVIFLPFNITIEAKEGESILDVALRNHIDLEHRCGGVCACSTCHVFIKKGMDHLPEMTPQEEDQLDEAEGLTLESRLGCQCVLPGDDIEIVVEIPQINEAISSLFKEVPH